MKAKGFWLVLILLLHCKRFDEPHKTEVCAKRQYYHHRLLKQQKTWNSEGIKKENVFRQTPVIQSRKLYH
jgi:hypothetical protein